MKRVTIKQLRDFVKIIKAEHNVDIRIYNEGRGVSIIRYEAYENNQPSVIRCKSKKDAMVELETILKTLYGC